MSGIQGRDFSQRVAGFPQPGDAADSGHRRGKRLLSRRWLRTRHELRLDYRFGKCVFGQPEVNLGITPGFGGATATTP